MKGTDGQSHRMMPGCYTHTDYLLTWPASIIPTHTFQFSLWSKQCPQKSLSKSFRVFLFWLMISFPGKTQETCTWMLKTTAKYYFIRLLSSSLLSSIYYNFLWTISMYLPPTSFLRWYRRWLVKTQTVENVLTQEECSPLYQLRAWITRQVKVHS